MSLRRLEVKLDKLANLDLTKALTKGCLIIENSAKVKAPVDTGYLRRSITHEVEGNVGLVGTNAEYAPYLEFGTGIFAEEGTGRQTPWRYQTPDGQWHTTKGRNPQPFLRPAFDENRSIVEKIIRDELGNAIKEVVNG